MSAAVLLLLALATADAAAERPGIEPETPLTAAIGEAFPRELRIHAGPAWRLEPQTLPRAIRLEEGVELRDSGYREETTENGRIYHIRLVYQAFHGLRGPERIELPALTLGFRQGATPMSLEVPAGSVTLMPVIPPELPDDAVTIRAAAIPQPESVAAAARTVVAALLVLTATALYGAWCRALFPFHGRRRKPFARAWRELPRLLGQGADAAAFRCVHRALDRTAGYPLFGDRLDAFLESHPAYQPLREPLCRFFAASRQHFYAPPNRPGGGAAGRSYETAAELSDLCRTARDIERQAP